MTVATIPFFTKLEPIIPKVAEPIVYPDSDGQPMSDNTKQFRYITKIEGNFELIFEDDPNVFVAGDLLWYPVEGRSDIKQAPDVMLAFGRPKGDRGSYKQWEEANIPPQVVFEILSPGNRKKEMDEKFAFYERYGVEEYYVYDPDRGRLLGWQRDETEQLKPITRISFWQSPRLKVQFEMIGKDLHLRTENGRRFLTFVEIGKRLQRAEERVAEATDFALEMTELATQTEEQLQAERQARVEAETKAQTEAQARLEAEIKAQASEAKIAELEVKLRAAGLL